jgi:hypothetical protein
VLRTASASIFIRSAFVAFAVLSLIVHLRDA